MGTLGILGEKNFLSENQFLNINLSQKRMNCYEEKCKLEWMIFDPSMSAVSQNVPVMVPTLTATMPSPVLKLWWRIPTSPS